ncbi:MULTISPECIES: FecCD family ABC transporter permease [unclassified Leifsonia]|uniref:FecCD family ABC transporter permease n=1 Tax=unclassified Leifsonia TaxID=2663824 RepID=UPI000701BD64|nr:MULTISPECIES: iron chelate uptake ABC transporter family permease subunit [unclassified Leifsonia]KQX06481.1 iron ABC transporter permease [Leifsonia sp. Root1293]KRA10764.1 iron ABC transporter permease [Leifsonia sp. Root60]
MTTTDTAGAAPAITGARRRRGLRWIVFAASVVVLIGVVVASLTIGARAVSLTDVWNGLVAPVAGNVDHLVIRELRVPRTVIGIMAGAALALVGAVIQGVTRNPIADPGLLGINAGASLAVVVAISVLGISTPDGFIWFAFVGAALAAVIVFVIGSSGRDGATPVKLALTGAAVMATATPLITLLLISDLDTLNQYRFWSVGSLAGRELATAGALWPFLVVGLVLALLLGRRLNLLALGDDVARGLGERPAVTHVLAALAVIVLAGTATALAGPIALVGLVVPHVARRITGPDYRWILAYCLTLGPILLLAADVIGRVLVAPAELEAGIVVAFIGAPMLIAIVRRARLAGM